MAEKRISELTPKGSNLQSTDLLEVSVSIGGGLYQTRYVTGSEIQGSVISLNFANTNLTFTGNRTHDLDGYTLKLLGTVSTISPSSSSLDTAFGVRNFTDTADLFRVNGAGGVRADGGFTSTGINYLETIRSPFFVNSGITIISNLTYVSRGEIGVVYTSHQFDTDSTLTTSGTKIAHFANGGSIKWSIDKNGTVAMPGSQVGNSGLASGDTYFDTAANILTNGDLILARKV